MGSGSVKKEAEYPKDSPAGRTPVLHHRVQVIRRIPGFLSRIVANDRPEAETGRCIVRKGQDFASRRPLGQRMYPVHN